MEKTLELAVSQSVQKTLDDISSVTKSIEDTCQKILAIEKILDSNNAYQGAALKEMQSFLKLYDRHLQSLSVFYAVASLKASAQIEEVFKMDQKYAKGASGMEEK